ncbi:ABC transporter ATP-binding protein [Microbacterium sp. GXF7504]
MTAGGSWGAAGGAAGSWGAAGDAAGGAAGSWGAAGGAASLDARIEVRHPSGFVLAADVVAAAGETVAVMGPSGAGKSSLLGALAGVVPLDHGHVRLGGRELSAPGRAVAPAARDTVLLGQDPRLFPHLSALENVAFPLRARRRAKDAARARAQHLLERVGLPDVAGRKPGALSGGQQQRVAIARALAASPRLLLLDEPLTSLDPGTAAEIRMLLAELVRPLTCVVVTHDAVDAVALGDRLVVVEDGRVTQDGPVREVFARPATAFTAGVAGLCRVPGAVRGGVWTAGAVAVPAPGVADGAAVLVCPPGRVVLADGGAAASVVRVEQTVGGVLLHLDVPGLVCELPFDVWARHPLGPADAVRVTVDPAAARFLPA